MSKFGNGKGVSLRELTFEFFREAVEDTGIKKDEIQAVAFVDSSSNCSSSLCDDVEWVEYLTEGEMASFGAESGRALGG